MGIKNAARKTIAYAKRNGAKAAFFAAFERVSDTLKSGYDYVPLNSVVLEEQKADYKAFAEAGNSVRFSIVVPLFNTPEKYLKEMIDSVIAQTYGNWELVLADASPKPSDIVRDYLKEEPRIKYYHLNCNGGISENTNQGIDKATGDYIALLDHDDLLTPDALFENARVIRKSMRQNRLLRYDTCPVTLIYSDEDKFDDSKNVFYEHHAKPSFNLDYLLSNNYICHFTVLRADVIKRLKLRSQFDGAQDFDLFLRACAEISLKTPVASSKIVHIDKVLYHWRCHRNSTAANPASKEYAYVAGQNALKELVADYGIKADVEPLKHLGFYRINYEPDIFSCREDVGCIGGKILNKKGRIVSGAMTGEGEVLYKNLPEGFSGGLQHRAVLRQECAAVDLRCMAVRPELVELYETVTRTEYEDSFSPFLNENRDTNRGTSMAADDRFIELSEAEILRLSMKLCEEIRKRGYRVVWDPEAVKRI